MRHLQAYAARVEGLNCEHIHSGDADRNPTPLTRIDHQPSTPFQSDDAHNHFKDAINLLQFYFQIHMYSALGWALGWGLDSRCQNTDVYYLTGLRVSFLCLKLSDLSFCFCPDPMSYYQPTSHYGSRSRVGGDTHNLDSDFSPVDPFKPSIEYSVRNIWDQETSTDPPIVVRPSRPFPQEARSRSPSPSSRYYQRRRPRRSPSDTPSISSQSRRRYRHRQVLRPIGRHEPVVIIQRRSPSRSTSNISRRRRHHAREPVVQPEPIIVIQQRSRSSSQSPVYERGRRSRLAESVLQDEPTTVVRRRSSSRPSSIGSRSRSHQVPKPAARPHPNVGIHQRTTSPPSSDSSQYERGRRRRLPEPTIIVHRRSTSHSASDSLREPQRSRRRWRSRSRSRSLRHLPLVHGPPIPIPPTPLPPLDDRNPSRRRVRVYTAREKSKSPETGHGPTYTIPTSVSESVLPSNVFYMPPVSSERRSGSSPLFAKRKSLPIKAYVLAFVLDTLPRQIYLHLLLRLPYMYFTRVIRILEEANLSLPQIKRNILQAARQNLSSGPTYSVIQYGNLERTWGLFIDSLMKEWKTFNIISVLLLSTILAIINMTQASTNDPLTRFSALLSMVAALLSLIYGCIYSIRFQTMRKGYKALVWAEECESTKTSIFWNVWVFLAMPATWLAWSLIFFVVCLVSFIWRAGAIEDKQDRGLSRHQARIPRIIASSIFGIGFLYLILVISTLRRYGSVMDQKWKAQVKSWLDASGSNYMGTWVQPIPSITPYVVPQHYTPRSGNTQVHPVPSMASYATGISPPTIITDWPSQNVPNPSFVGNAWQWQAPVPVPAPSTYSGQSYGETSSFHDPPRRREPRRRRRSMPLHVDPDTVHVKGVSNLDVQKIKLVKLLDLSPDRKATFSPTDEDLTSCQISREEWTDLNADILKSWDPNNRDSESLRGSIVRWNSSTFHGKGGQIALCEEIGRGLLNRYAVYFFWTKDPLSEVAFSLDSISDDLRKLVIFSSD